MTEWYQHFLICFLSVLIIGTMFTILKVAGTEIISACGNAFCTHYDADYPNQEI